MTTESTENAPRVRRARLTVAERREQLQEKLAKLEAQAMKFEIEEAIASGECYDPAGAKALQRDLRYLSAARKAMIDYNLCDATAFAAVLTALEAALGEAVRGPGEND